MQYKLLLTNHMCKDPLSKQAYVPRAQGTWTLGDPPLPGTALSREDITSRPLRSLGLGLQARGPSAPPALGGVPDAG